LATKLLLDCNLPESHHPPAGGGLGELPGHGPVKIVWFIAVSSKPIAGGVPENSSQSSWD
jgi:hypothetical protein